ncbi:hypothetical protein M0R45_030855 [Rubus argutus]|uniref:Uncharacterized protein n=1 Tax=Rubus argutus TaxID=59490 RepID=A0AAW1WED0_RUBAR
MAAISECGSREVHDWLGEMRRRFGSMTWEEADFEEAVGERRGFWVLFGEAKKVRSHGGFAWVGLVMP